MISNDLFTAVFGAVPDGDPDVPGALTKAAVEAGFALTLVDPNDHKKALCTLTAVEKKAADKEVKDAALEAGDDRWDVRTHACAVYHAFTDFTKDGAARSRTVTARMVKRHSRVNFGVVPGASLVGGKHRLVAVDFDTAAEKSAFYRVWSEKAGHDVTADKGPTVVSPGKVRVNESGEETWVHKDGGHHWFLLPEGLDLTGLPMQKITGDGGWVAIFGAGLHVLVPPSARSEGPYRLTGQMEMIPDWLLEFITSEGERVTTIRAEKESKARTVYENDPVDAWAANLSWADLIEPDGWTLNGQLDGCDCPEATRPGGDHSHTKSATLHQPGCSERYDTSRGHGPMYVWTDNAPEFLREYISRTGSRAVTKLQYVALRDHGGSPGDAMRALGLPRIVENQYADLWTSTEEPTGTNDHYHTGSDEQPSLFDNPPEDDNEPPADSEEKPPPHWPDELKDLAVLLAAENLPNELRNQVMDAARRDWAQEEYRRLKNRSSVEEIRARMRLSIDRLSDVVEDNEEDLWRIRGLWMQQQIIMLTAKWKAGKTTMVTNVVRSLVDGTPFLGQFETTPITDGTVVIVNAEMTRRQFNRWMFESNITNRDKVLAFHVREAGPASGDILDPTRRDEMVALLIEHNAKVLIMDPLNPLLSSSGVEENSSTDVAKWFTAMNDIKERAGLDEIMLVHHFGHNGQRGRGSSKFMDAPDALWTYTMDDTEEDPDDELEDMLGPVKRPGAPRYLSAVGRDVDLPKSVVEFDPETRVLTIPSLGGLPMSMRESKKQKDARKLDRNVAKVVKLVGNKPGIGSNELQAEYAGNTTEYQSAKKSALDRKLIENRGKSSSHMYYLTETKETK